MCHEKFTNFQNIFFNILYNILVLKEQNNIEL